MIADVYFNGLRSELHAALMHLFYPNRCDFVVGFVFMADGTILHEFYAWCFWAPVRGFPELESDFRLIEQTNEPTEPWKEQNHSPAG